MKEQSLQDRTIVGHINVVSEIPVYAQTRVGGEKIYKVEHQGMKYETMCSMANKPIVDQEHIEARTLQQLYEYIDSIPGGPTTGIITQNKVNKLMHDIFDRCRTNRCLDEVVDFHSLETFIRAKLMSLLPTT